ncbi:unnamed protein product [Paramecium octaurelia]|uniref:Transmembrane protein n=1 Tax=Paramecium octaurelia TaxID=43137 RepID=A0A8S1XTX2_PAROT|nr:unnamed protein product [Paramecium octaurelia]
MIFRKNGTEIFRGVTYCIDEITHQLQKEPLFEVKFDLNDREKGFQSIKTGNLIVFKGLPILLIYQIVELNLKLIPNQFNIIEIIKIKGDNQLYVSLSLEMNDILLFQILIVNEIQFESKGSAILKFENIRVELFNHFRNYQLISFDKFRMLEFLECLIEDGQVKIIGLLMIEETQVISEIIIQMVSFRISYNLIKITRINLKSDDEVQLVYYCQNILILRLSSSAITYFYDLTGNQVITDYIGRQTGLYHSYHILNTTHLVVYSNLEDIIFFAEVGYEIHFNEVYQGNNTFTLVAQNMLSSIQLNVTMIDINHGQIQDQNFIIIYLSIFILTLVVYFLIRRRKIKYQLLNNQKFDGIDLNNQQQND